MAPRPRVVRLVAIAGSTRQGSFNAQLLATAVRGAEAFGAQVSTINLSDYALPIYDADSREKGGLPPAALALQNLLCAHDGLLLATPEYNGSMPPLLLNTLTWLARPAASEPPAAAFKDKVAMLLSASPAATGGLRGLAQLSALLGHLGVLVLPYPIGIANAETAFDDHGELLDQGLSGKVRESGAELARFIGSLLRG